MRYLYGEVMALNVEWHTNSTPVVREASRPMLARLVPRVCCMRGMMLGLALARDELALLTVVCLIAGV